MNSWNGRELLPAALTQKAAISAIDHGAAVSDEADRAVPQRRGLPDFGGNAGFSIEDLANVAVTRPIDMPVDCLQHPAQPLTPLRGQSSIRSGWSIMQNAPEAKGRFDTIEAGTIERDDRNQRLVRPRLINEQNAKSPKVIGHRQTGSTGIMHNSVRFNRGEIDGLETRDWRSGRKDDSARIYLRLPIDNRLQGSPLGIDREIATPKTDAQDASGHRGPLSSQWRGHNRVGSRCFDAAIPMRDPVPSGIRHSRTLMPSANAMGLGAFQSSGRAHWVNQASFNQKVSRGKSGDLAFTGNGNILPGQCVEPPKSCR
jgi:hypothetical protein